MFDAEDGAGLVYIERSKTDQAGRGSIRRAITPDTLAALKQLREDSGLMTADDALCIRALDVRR